MGSLQAFSKQAQIGSPGQACSSQFSGLDSVGDVERLVVGGSAQVRVKLHAPGCLRLPPTCSTICKVPVI